MFTRVIKYKYTCVATRHQNTPLQFETYIATLSHMWPATMSHVHPPVSLATMSHMCPATVSPILHHTRRHHHTCVVVRAHCSASCLAYPTNDAIPGATSNYGTARQPVTVSYTSQTQTQSSLTLGALRVLGSFGRLRLRLRPRLRLKPPRLALATASPTALAAPARRVHQERRICITTARRL